MKKFIFKISILLFFPGAVFAQKFYTKNGSISFFSKTSLENIQADNNQVMSVINTETGDIQFSLLIRGFHFARALMEEHFNEDYMESDKFPRSTFKGSITDMSRVSFTTDGIYTIAVSGDIMIHGITKKITATGNIIVKAGQITASAKFLITLSDYNISIPNLVKDNIAESVEISLLSNFDQKM